jgi:hypothetical protein
MSWQDIIKQKKFNFDDLRFTKHSKGWRTNYDFGEGVAFSVIAGFYTHSTPQEYLEDPMGYEKYEVMLGHPEISNPQEIGIMENDMVFTYKTKEEITEYARKVEANLPSKLKQNKQKKNLGRLVDAFKE